MYDLNSIHVFCADQFREGVIPRLVSVKGAVKAYMRGYPLPLICVLIYLDVLKTSVLFFEI